MERIKHIGEIEGEDNPIVIRNVHFTLHGFVQHLRKHKRGKQYKYLFPGLVRMARDHPEVDPRLVLLEWMAEEVFRYEQKLTRITFDPSATTAGIRQTKDDTE